MTGLKEGNTIVQGRKKSDVVVEFISTSGTGMARYSLNHLSTNKSFSFSRMLPEIEKNSSLFARAISC